MYIIAGLYRRQHLITPKGIHTRPTANRLREALFNICQNVIEGAHFLDLFAGSGAMGLEALSRGAASATFIESNKESIFCIQKNIASLKLEKQTHILKGEVFSVLKMFEKQKQAFDLIYADPPYQTVALHTSQYYSEKIIEWIDQSELLTPEGLFFVEETFRSQPQLKKLLKLKLKDSRRFGDTALQQYQRED